MNKITNMFDWLKNKTPMSSTGVYLEDSLGVRTPMESECDQPHHGTRAGNVVSFISCVFEGVPWFSNSSDCDQVFLFMSCTLEGVDFSVKTGEIEFNLTGCRLINCKNLPDQVYHCEIIED